jgi:RHS repeat-associated protein
LPHALSFFLSLLLLLQAGVFTAHGMMVYLDRDNTGSTLLRTDDSGKVIGQAGVQTDPNGLLNMRARYYSPYLMRFLNADPSGFSGGPNWFAYADGNPISKSDPFGLATFGVGLQGGGGLLLGLTGSAGFYVGKTGWNPASGWSSGLIFSLGGGIAAGAGGSGGVFAQFTNAPNVNNLKGPGFDVGISGGEGFVAGIDYVGGLGNTNGDNFPVNTTTYKGLALNLGVGGGTPVEGHANVTGSAGWTTKPWPAAPANPPTSAVIGTRLK